MFTLILGLTLLLVSFGALVIAPAKFAARLLSLSAEKSHGARLLGSVGLIWLALLIMTNRQLKLLDLSRDVSDTLIKVRRCVACILIALFVVLLIRCVCSKKLSSRK